jgi:hypothetical protein
MPHREEREKREREEYERLNPKISHQFADAKRALASVTDEEWASIPEAGDYTGRNKRARRERMQRAYAVPDSVLAAARSAGEKPNFDQLESAQKLTSLKAKWIQASMSQIIPEMPRMLPRRISAISARLARTYLLPNSLRQKRKLQRPKLGTILVLIRTL